MTSTDLVLTGGTIRTLGGPVVRELAIAAIAWAMARRQVRFEDSGRSRTVAVRS